MGISSSYNVYWTDEGTGLSNSYQFFAVATFKILSTIHIET